MSMSRVISLALGLLLIATAAAAGPGRDCDAGAVEVFGRAHSGIAEAEYALIDNQGDWCAFWDRAWGNVIPAPPCDVLAVDFEQEVALVAAIGTRSNGCHGVAIACVEALGSSDNIRVTTVEHVDGGTCACTQATVAPLHVVKVPALVRHVTWRHQIAVLDCD